MDVIEDVRDSIVPSSDDGTTAYRCTDCLAEFDKRQHLCPECGGERFNTV